jgi:DNA polymerase III epsilon subunit-like protein
MRQVVLDTETTGINPSDGHRIIEIGCLEIENRRLTGVVFIVIYSQTVKLKLRRLRYTALPMSFCSTSPVLKMS